MTTRLVKYGVAFAPRGPITTLLAGVLNGWYYDFRNPANQLAEHSQRLRNVADDALGQYNKQLKDELSNLRQQIPEPTRENPFPDVSDIKSAIKELETYMHDVEGVRTSIINAPIPARDMIWHGADAHVQLLRDLEQTDRQILSELSDLSPEKIGVVKRLLQGRSSILAQFSTDFIR